MVTRKLKSNARQRDLERKPFRIDCFADRDVEIKVLATKIAKAQTGKNATPVIQFYAIKGQGKSWLLRQFLNLFEVEKTSKKAKNVKSAVAALVDFDTVREKPANQPFAILSTLRQGLHSSASHLKPGARAKHQVSAVQRLASATQQFTEDVAALAERHVPILIFDTTDKANEQVLGWIEDQLILPLIQKGRVIFVLAGRRALFWNYFEVRRCSEAYELLPLSSQGSSDQMELENQNTKVGELLFEFSKGHPEINWRILQGLRYDQRISKLDKAIIELNRPYILDRVREIVDSQFLVELSQESYKLLWDVCVLRRFNTDQLRYFAAKQSPEKRDRPEGDFLEIIQQMLDVAIVHWDTEKGGYVLDATIREIMLENFKDRDPKRFEEQEKLALGMYTEWMERYPDNLEDYFVEFVYHRSILQLSTKPDRESRKRFLEEVGSVQRRYLQGRLPTSIRKDEDITRVLRSSDPQLLEELLKRPSPKPVLA